MFSCCCKLYHSFPTKEVVTVFTNVSQSVPMIVLVTTAFLCSHYKKESLTQKGIFFSSLISPKLISPQQLSIHVKEKIPLEISCF